MPVLRAYAKINLGLHILGSRDDGFHDLETVYHRIDLFDELTLDPAEAISIECFPPELPSDERNICYRAAAILREELGRRDGVHIRLRKNIPSGAGLGGGSADAASTLRGLLRLWEAPLATDRLRSIAAQLGSDVPYFLQRGTAYATGRGEILDYFAFELPYWIVVVCPDISISTAWAYQELKDRANPRTPPAAPATHHSLKDILIENLRDPRLLRNLLRNDFEPIVLGTHEPVARLKRRLYEAGSEMAMLSGSGSAVYGLFPSEATARNAAEEFAREYRVSVSAPNFDPDVP